MSIIFMFVLTGSDSQTFSMSGRGAILFSLSVFGEPSRAPKLDASEMIGHSKTTAAYHLLLTLLQTSGLVAPALPRWGNGFGDAFSLPHQFHHSFGWEATAAVSVVNEFCAQNELPGYGLPTKRSFLIIGHIHANSSFGIVVIPHLSCLGLKW